MGKDQDILKQVEYYLSDANLKTDPFFHGLITADKEVGKVLLILQAWLGIDFVLKCNKIKKLKTNKEDIARVAKDSKELEVDETGNKLRRKGKKALPKLEEGKPKRQQKGADKEEIKKEEEDAEDMNPGVFQQEDVADP